MNDTVTTLDETSASNGGTSWRDRLGDTQNLGLIAVLVLAFVAGWVTSPDTFLDANNFLTILKSAAVIGVVSVGMTFVIIGGGIDLSVGAIVALASVWGTTVASQEMGLWGMLFAFLAVGTATGLVNGVLIAYGKIVSFIATLAMLVSARGLAQYISDGQTQIVEVSAFRSLNNGDVFGIPNLVVMLIVVAAIGWFVLNRTTFGRRTFAVGGNPEAARLAGINVKRQTMLLFTLSGLACGIAAIMIVARTTTGSSTHGNLYELDAIGAVVIGGTSLAGGRGTMVGTVLGVLVFTVMTNIFVLNNLTTDLQNIAKGVIIVLAVLLQQRTQRGSDGAHA
ncbi:ABC transporter permease [Salsipaludibacter albus]|uniref:ABC transporter permease n=1 Tax=Salsipaludibacter albus TaxID=2849650 RepID=UPI001EE43DF1|nr:ABC transporter permease [Salsipaludibacter albus]MBY5163858.1 ABC transporter permease [Salsipaludibacter albus]